jgi:2-succinyl-6-hydroxy-2,4-cyclohexadiene-1-carboxylate synthase
MGGKSVNYETAETLTTVLLHGFWGQPADWNLILSRLPLTARILAPDLYLNEHLGPNTAFNEWPKRFWEWIDHELGEVQIDLVGYSMGARLALAALLGQPHRVHRALLISGQPVLMDSAGERKAWEELMAERFATEDWSVLERVWQDQAVFAQTQPVERRHSEVLRSRLGLSLRNWSPRLHGFGWSNLQSLPKSVEWAFGALDQKYTQAVKSLQDLPVQGQITVLPEVGHRVIHEAAPWVSQWISKQSEGIAP